MYYGDFVYLCTNVLRATLFKVNFCSKDKGYTYQKILYVSMLILFYI